MNKKDTWVLVTGASSGIGASLSIELASRANNFVLVARSREGLETTESLIKQKRPQAQVKLLCFDLSQLDHIDKLLAQLSNDHIVPEIVVNNAGFGLNGPEIESSWEKEKSMLDLNITSLTYLTKLLAKMMVDSGIQGSILQLASIGAHFPMPKLAAYAATKAYVLHYSLALREELKPYGITISVLSPGATATKFFERSGQKEISRSQAKLMMTSEKVAEIAIKGLFKKKAEIIPGSTNRFFAIGTKFMSRSRAAKLVMTQI